MFHDSQHWKVLDQRTRQSAWIQREGNGQGNLSAILCIAAGCKQTNTCANCGMKDDELLLYIRNSHPIHPLAVAFQIDAHGAHSGWTVYRDGKALREAQLELLPPARRGFAQISPSFNAIRCALKPDAVIPSDVCTVVAQLVGEPSHRQRMTEEIARRTPARISQEDSFIMVKAECRF
jgi:hypothetical protein